MVLTIPNCLHANKTQIFATGFRSSPQITQILRIFQQIIHVVCVISRAIFTVSKRCCVCIEFIMHAICVNYTGTLLDFCFGSRSNLPGFL